MTKVVWIVPLTVFLFLLAFSFVLWTWYARLEKYEEGTKEHSERIYRDFEFFTKILIALVGALGYVRFTYFAKDPMLARQAMVGIGALAMFAMVTLGIFVACHQGSKIRRWKTVEWKTLFFWQEVWMLLAMYCLAAAVWVTAFVW